MTINERGFNFFISNEDKIKEEIMALGIEEIFYNCILKKHPKEVKKMLIAVPGKRGNQGPNLGVTGVRVMNAILKQRYKNQQLPLVGCNATDDLAT